MRWKAKELIIAIVAILLASVFWLTPALGQSPPTGEALSTFEALHSAENAGANITSLVGQYNTLLRQSASNSSFVALGQVASNAQQKALALRSFNQTLTIVLVPVIALIIAVASEGLLQLRRKIERERILEMELKQT